MNGQLCLKMCTKTIYFFVLLLVGVHSANVKNRQRRFIGGTRTSYVTSTQLFTSLVPSSCVAIDPTLQPCRSVRYLGFPNFAPWGTVFNKAVQAKSIKTEATPLGWGEYLGIYAPTVTVTQLELHTTFVKDPSVVVTYAVKGCRPHKIPEDLDRCELPQTIPIQTIIPTSTVTTASQTSSIADNVVGSNTVLNATAGNNELNNRTNEVHQIIESSKENTLNENRQPKLATEPLPF